ncbi:hypothetical protein LCGC14_2094420 [marine sediment metagenome]|uniref:Uncharacterized protein n=1 Tax=marine sediment metagenome TaxID=412755 RepID=A0A0F9EZ41_9ZZZZ
MYKIVKKKPLIISAFILTIGFSITIGVFINISKSSQTTQYTVDFNENDEFIWEIKYIDNSRINESDLWTLFTEFELGAKMKIQFDFVRKIKNDTIWSIFYSIWDWTTEPFDNNQDFVAGSFPPLVPEPYAYFTFYELFIFTPCNKYLNSLLSSNSVIIFQDNIVWFNDTDYTIERTYDYSTGILSLYRVYLDKIIIFSSELL